MLSSEEVEEYASTPPLLRAEISAGGGEGTECGRANQRP